MISSGSQIQWVDFDGELRRGRLVREEQGRTGPLAIIDYSSTGGAEMDRTTCIDRDAVIDPGEERIRNISGLLRDDLKHERERHQQAIESLLARLEAVHQECGHCFGPDKLWSGKRDGFIDTCSICGWEQE